MDLNQQLTQDLKNAMKAHDKTALTVIRMLKADLMNAKVKVNRDLTEEEALDVVAKEVKQHKESIEEFKKGNRDDLVKDQEVELNILNQYAPAQMSEAEINQIVDETIKSTNATNMGDFGKVMGAVMGKVKGKADGTVVNQAVKARLK